MASVTPFERQESNGLGWADQWDYKFNDEVARKENREKQKEDNKQKLAEYNKKVKAVASNGMEKTKAAVTVGAQKVMSGTTTSFRWLKEKVQKKNWKIDTYLSYTTSCVCFSHTALAVVALLLFPYVQIFLRSLILREHSQFVSLPV